MQANQIAGGFFIVFERGEEFVSELTRFCEKEEVHWATFQGIGTFEDVEIGYYDLEARQYVMRNEEGPFEVASITGNVAEINEGPIVHTHGVLSRCDNSLECIGGHIKSAYIAATLEISLWRVSMPIMRRYDDETGLNLIEIIS